MEPVNQSERNSAIYRFLGLFGLAIVAVFAFAFTLFNTPASLFKTKFQFFRNSAEEQDRLLSKADRMTVNLTNLLQTDKTYSSSSNEIEKANLQSRINEYQKNISDGLVELQNDSVNYASSAAKKDAYNYITAYNTILIYKSLNNSLQNSLATKGANAAELGKVNADLQACKLQLGIATLAASNANRAPANQPAGGGGGGSSAKETQLQQALDKCQADLAASIKSKTGNVTPVVQQQPANFDDRNKAMVLFDAAQDLYNNAEKTKIPIEKRTILNSAKFLFQKSSAAYPEPDKVKKAIIQIDTELYQLAHMG